VSRWLQQQIQPQFPDVQILEVLAADSGFYQVNETTCKEWMTTNSLSHPVLRDKGQSGSIAAILAMEVKDLMVVDRRLKIVYKGRVTDQFAQNKVMNTLSQLQ
jgi:hypothetical protein